MFVVNMDLRPTVGSGARMEMGQNPGFLTGAHTPKMLARIYSCQGCAEDHPGCIPPTSTV